MPDTATTPAEPSADVLGPGQLAGASDSDPFVLASADWIKVQVYIEQGIALPKTKDDLAIWVNGSIDDLMDHFNLLKDAHLNIETHCTKWKTDIYPSSVNLANSIVHYNQDVPDLYQALLDTIDTIRKAMSKKDQDAINQGKQDFKDLLADRSQKARDFATQADTVATAISGFVSDTEADQTQMNTVKKDFDDTFGSESDEVKSLKDQMAEQENVLATADAEYRHDCIVAETTPTYAWCWPLGTIAGAVVAGVYGDRAVKALHAKQAAQAQINQLSAEIKRDESLLAVVTFAKTSIDGLLDHLNAALPIIQKIKGIWNAIASDIDNLADLMTNDIEKAALIVEKVKIKGAIAAWDKLSTKADKYRVNAYVTVEGSPATALEQSNSVH
ncbi:MAG TPA: alpha-xenorhabdolysin family binary toxin subunit A [Pyrinomonadaceae bacterium]|nr:alpha-xenorhabdolysin family binary toxin subunit A [Pyrinomonadaceae bacterium]